MQAWALKSVGDDRSWDSNDGYEDVLGSCYLYDSKVGNHKNVREGDLIVVWSRTTVFGVSKVSRIEATPGTKVRRLCPRCKRTGIAASKTKSPKYLCGKCQIRFETPELFEEDVTHFSAFYEQDWRTLEDRITPLQLEQVVITRDPQSAIRRCDPEELAELLRQVQVLAPLAEPEPEWGAAPEGGHRTAVRKVRIGQARFRRLLIDRYKDHCAITGKTPESALEAAHLHQFSTTGTHDPRQGLLLRADIHSLFDRGLLAVDPTTMTVAVAPELNPYPCYQQLHGATVDADVDLNSLGIHYSRTVAAWTSDQ